MIRDEHGFTLIEALVAVTILLVGILTSLQAIDASRRLTLVTERKTSLEHRAQLELERVKSLPYSQIGLTVTSSSWSTDSTQPTYVSAPAGTCPGTPSGAAPTYQPDQLSGGSAATEPLVITGCSYTTNGVSTPFVSGNVAPVTSWSDGRFSGSIYDFVTWRSDPTCNQTSSPGAICPTSNDYKRVTIVVTLTSTDRTTQPALVSSFVADPNASPPGAPANSQQNPISNPSTSCQNSAGQTISCSNTLSGTPQQYFPIDCAYNSSCTTPPCAGNSLHQTLFSVLSNPAAPDQLSPSLPTGNCADGSGTPTPPCFATDAGCGSGAGLPIPANGTTCGSPPTDNSKVHSWVAPQIPVGTTVNLNGTGSLTTYLESTTSAAVNATVCLGLYVVPGGVLGTVSGNLLSQPIGVTASASVTAAAGVPSPVSFNFNVGSTAALSSTALNAVRIEVVVWIAASAGTTPSFVYDQAQFASQITLMTT